MKKKYPNFEVSQFENRWTWIINLSRSTILESNWTYKTRGSALSAARRWGKIISVMGIPITEQKQQVIIATEEEGECI